MHIDHDFHIHTNLSVCAKRDATLDSYIEKAKKSGMRKIGISNHFWDEKIEGANAFYRPQTFNHVESLRKEIEKADIPGLSIYFGCECEYDPYHHGIACTEETAEKFEYMLVPNSHTHMMMDRSLYHPYEKHTEFMINAYKEILSSPVSRYVTAIAHPFEAVSCLYDYGILMDLISDDTFKRLFSKTADKGIAFEINMSSMLYKTPEQIEKAHEIRMFRIAKEEGCRFIFGSDAHCAEECDTYRNADYLSALIGLRDEDIADIAK